MTKAETRLRELLHERILVLDGAWGVLLQGRGLSEEDFRGERFRDHPRDVKGDPDLLNLTQPQIVSETHEAYFAAGADIATTNTFTATSIGQADYGLEEAVFDMNVAGARLARAAADAAPDRFVAGSVGPLNVTLSLSPKVDDPSFRTVTFERVYDAYAEQVRGLRDRIVSRIEIPDDTVSCAFRRLCSPVLQPCGEGSNKRDNTFSEGDDLLFHEKTPIPADIPLREH